jgi:hypothetical protein
MAGECVDAEVLREVLEAGAAVQSASALRNKGYERLRMFLSGTAAAIYIDKSVVSRRLSSGKL